MGSILAVVLLAGCSGWRAGPPSPFSNLDASLASLESIYSAEAINDCLRTPSTGSLAEAHRTCRNIIAQALMTAIDVRYAIFEQELLNTQRYTGLAATIVQLGLTAGASVASGGTTQALAAAATAVGGVNEAVGREVLVNRTATALQSSMQARRNEVAVRLRVGLLQAADVYPLGIALSDLLAYYRAGTLVGATVALSEAASAQAVLSRQSLDATVGLQPEAMAPIAAQVPVMAGPRIVAPVLPPIAAPQPTRAAPAEAGAPISQGFSRTPNANRLAACITGTTRTRDEKLASLQVLRQALLQQPNGARWIRNEVSLARSADATAEALRATLLALPDVDRACPVLN